MGAIEGQQVFELKRILSVENIQLSARTQASAKQIVALVTQNGDLILYYTNGDSPAVLRRVPWFLEREKRITSLAFHPAGSWLLVTGWDGFLHIVPTLSLVDPKSVSDQSWNPLDLTSFPSVTTSPPTCCVWWQSTALGHQMGLVGTESGDITLINLNTGQRLGTRKISGSLSMLHICHDNSDSAYLLMTCEDRQQWRVLLEDRDGSWFWPEEPGRSSSRVLMREEINGLSPAPSARSRLQGLKQMSVEKLAIIRQRLAETRSKTTSSNLSTSSNVTSRRGSGSSDGSARSSDASTPSSNTVPQVENLRWIVNAFLWPQTLRGRQVLSAYHAQSSFVSMYKIEDLEQPPAYGHKLSFPCRDMLVTERFLYLTDTTAKRFSVVSSKLSECRRHDDLELSPESVVDSFEFSGEERIIALYKVSHAKTYQGGSVPVVSASGLNVKSSKYLRHENTANKPNKEAPKSHDQWLEQEVERLRGPAIDTCIVVTTHSIYHVVLKQCAVRKVLNHLLAGVEPDKAGQLLCAESLSRMFALDLQRLLELAGDIQLFKGCYVKAIELYKLARCRQIKWIVKLAAGGHSGQLLIALQEGALMANSQDANPVERCQLSNLAVLCQAQQYLSTESPDLFNGFVKFLKLNQYYDEQMAVNIFGQNHLWPFLNELACFRGLLPEVLEAQAKMMSYVLSECDVTQKQKQLLLMTQVGFWESVSEGCLREAFLQRPQFVRIHCSFIKSCLDLLELDVLKRLAALYDPTHPALRPGLLQLFRSTRSREGSNERELSVSFDSASVSSYSSDFVEPAIAVSENVSVMEDLVMTFMLLLFQIWHKRNDTEYKPDLAASVVRLPKRVNDSQPSQGVEVLSLVTCELSAGYGHAALVRNSGLFTWGRNNHGCVGMGPTMNRLSQPRPILTFNSLRTHVLSVACGQNHTLALTENGLYSWGSSTYGQLGLGNIVQSPYPRLITSLLDHRIVAIAAGQYHSLALTSTGRVFSWGWGVHGQLGHGSVENQPVPIMLSAFEGQVVNAVGGGHAHSLFLLSSGQVFACGSSVFGQLGTGNNIKSSLPTPVCNLPESITTIATGYFHNLAISKSNRLYMWGSSPQVLRMQAQAQKKARMLLQQQLLQQQQQRQQQTQQLQKEQQLCQENLKKVTSEDQYSTGDLQEDQFQIITLKDCQDNTEEISENRLDANSVDSQDSEKSESPPKVMNNVRFNRPQEIFVDPLNATCLFPSSELCHPQVTNNDQSHDPEGVSTNSKSQGNEEPEILLKAALPIPDLLAEAVPKVVVDLVHTVKLAASNPISVPPAEAGVVPPVNMDVETSQSHLLPSLVDTSLVEGLIAEIACGCHHSALVTEEGRVYTWGRNIDGQLGHSGRKEAPIPTLVPDIRAAQIACGADFTLALHADGQVFGWGSNATAQIGRMPQKEPNKGLEGKTIMLNTSKRVIKIPNSANNRIESPQEIQGIPPSSPTPAYSSATLSAAPAAAWATELAVIEQPPYCSLTLHWALHRFFPYFSSGTLLHKSLLQGNLQAAGRLSLLAKDIPASLGYQMDAFIRTWKEKSYSSTNINQSKEKPPSPIVNLKLDDQQELLVIGSSDTSEHTSSSTATLNDENGGSSQSDNSEMHAFSVQGGNEEMSEGTDSDNTKSNQQPSDETSSMASVSLEEQDMVPPKSGSQTDIAKEPSVEKSNSLPEDGEIHVDKQNTKQYSWLQHEIFRLFELHLNLVEEEEQEESVISLLLQKIVTFWVKQNVPPSILEQLLQQHWKELAYPFANLIFCSDMDGNEKLIESLSTCFMMKLCSSMISQLKNKGECPELNTLLMRLMSQKGLWKQTNDSSAVTMDQLVEHLTSNSAGRRALQIEPLHDSLDNNNIVAFSCGHQLNWHDYNAEVAAAQTDGSALAGVLSDREDAVFQHACPSCVAQYLQRIKL